MPASTARVVTVSHRIPSRWSLVCTHRFLAFFFNLLLTLLTQVFWGASPKENENIRAKSLPHHVSWGEPSPESRDMPRNEHICPAEVEAQDHFWPFYILTARGLSWYAVWDQPFKRGSPKWFLTNNSIWACEVKFYLSFKNIGCYVLEPQWCLSLSLDYLTSNLLLL